VAGNKFAASWAFSRFFLFFQKLLHPLFFDESRIVYHAHSVAGFVPVVNGSQPVTWKIRTFKTEILFTIQ